MLVWPSVKVSGWCVSSTETMGRLNALQKRTALVTCSNSGRLCQKTADSRMYPSRFRAEDQLQEELRPAQRPALVLKTVSLNASFNTGMSDSVQRDATHLGKRAAR